MVVLEDLAVVQQQFVVTNDLRDAKNGNRWGFLISFQLKSRFLTWKPVMITRFSQGGERESEGYQRLRKNFTQVTESGEVGAAEAGKSSSGVKMT
jgi:hypothetical protein